METIFREAPVAQEPSIPQPIKETPNVVDGIDDLAVNKTSDSDVDMSLEVWENENNRKYGVDYFDIRETAHEFPVNAQFGFIDKYVKAEITERGWKSDKSSYSKILNEIEREIGTDNFTQYKRLQKIFNYIQVVKKYKDIKAKKESFRSLNGGL